MRDMRDMRDQPQDSAKKCGPTSGTVSKSSGTCGTCLGRCGTYYTGPIQPCITYLMYYLNIVELSNISNNWLRNIKITLKPPLRPTDRLGINHLTRGPGWELHTAAFICGGAPPPGSVHSARTASPDGGYITYCSQAGDHITHYRLASYSQAVIMRSTPVRGVCVQRIEVCH